jgi:chromosome segregation protein
MLRIEKVFLQGFKSFSDPTELVFDPEGITAIVGPNGCGKSNISDGVSWVIGEQRAKALRGGKMEDVIFQGSRNRPSSGMAEVVLTLLVQETFEIRSSENGHQGEVEAIGESQAVEPQDPPPAALPVEAQSDAEHKALSPTEKQKKRRKHSTKETSRVYQEGERITVARRLYRTGESEYEMNGRTCRLRDIQDLFAGTGLGGAHYAIIEQGRIGQVLSAKPLDRRALIEEAAGISKFKLRQRAAELKLEASKQNLARLTDILAEVERQQNSLKRQAARARRYQRLRQEMRDLMRAVYVADYRTTRSALASLEAQHSAVAERESQLLAFVVNREAEHAQAAELERQAEEQLNETRQLAANADLEAERARQQHAHLNEQLQTLAARSVQFERDRAAINERRGFIEQESERLRAELERLEQELTSEGLALAAEEERHRAQMDNDLQAEQRLEEARREVYDSATQLERWRQLKQQFADSVERSQTRRRGLAAEGQRALGHAEAAASERAALMAALEESSRQQQENSERLQALETTLDDDRLLSADRQTALAAQQRDLAAVEHRLKSLEELDDRRAYFSEAVQMVMNQAQLFHPLGTLADFVHVEPEYEGMIEAGLRDDLQYLLVPGFDDALRAIDFLKTEGRGRATFLVVGLHGGESHSAILSSEPEPENELDQNGPEATEAGATNGAERSETDEPTAADVAIDWPSNDAPSSEHRLSLISLLGLRPEFQEAFKLALPRLAGAAVVADAEQAIQSSLQRNGDESATVYLARTGERVVAGRVIAGGSHSETGAGVLALKREIAELRQRFEVLSAEARQAEEEWQAIQARIARLEERRAELAGRLHEVEKQTAVQREQWQQCERERERAATHLRVIETESRQAAEELADFEGKLAHAAAELTTAEQRQAKLEQTVLETQAALAELRREAEGRSQELSRRQAEFAAKSERSRGLHNDLRRLEQEANDLHSRLNRSRIEALETEEQTSAARAGLETLAEQRQHLTAQQQAYGTELEQQAASLTAAREKLSALAQELKELREASSQAREERAQLEIERARLQSALEHIAASCRHELSEQIEEICRKLEQADSQSSDRSLPPDSDRSDESAQRYQMLDEEAEEADGEPGEEGALDELAFWQVPEHFDLAAAKARLDELRAKIDSLGPVNMMALEEIDQVQERFRFLSAQKTDIEKAILDTQAAIAEIKRRSRERFREAFEAINLNFSQMFQELFGGGHGEMRLIDESDILESGIDIIAQPPGKRLQNILLLSGGEKAMAAMALVLAIFKYRPSPFCLLDEVDAPLDEVNIGRFVEKVKEMSHDTQFMIITHNKRTMESANTLYGVTMEDPGVSKLVSVKLT